MITEYTNCAELMRLISDQKIKPAVIKRYLSKQGIIFTATNAQTFAKDVYTIFLGGQETSNITQMIANDGNYEKSTLINAKLKGDCGETDILDFSRVILILTIPPDPKAIILNNQLNQKKSKSEVAIDIRQPSSIDAQKALDILKK